MCPSVTALPGLCDRQVLGGPGPWPRSLTWPEVPRKWSSCTALPPMHGGHEVLELLGNHWKGPKNKSRFASPRLPRAWLPETARQEAESLGSASGLGEPWGNRVASWGRGPELVLRWVCLEQPNFLNQEKITGFISF